MCERVTFQNFYHINVRNTINPIPIRLGRGGVIPPLPLLPIVHVQEAVLAAEEGRRRCKADAGDDYDNDDGVDNAGGDDDDGLSF
jgi:hypothetical protein